MLKFVFLLLALNFDALVAGLALGVAAIRVRSTARLLVAAVSGGGFAVAQLLGGSLVVLLPVEWLHTFGLGVLLLVTLAWLKKFCGPGRGGLAGIWRRPRELDADSDHSLSLTETVVLSLALALDVMCGGLAMGMLGEMSRLWIVVSAVIAFVMFAGANRLGLEIGHALSEE